MLMTVYQGAIDASRKGNPQYVIERSLDIFRTDDKKHALYYLTGGWDIRAVCVNGVLKETWKFSVLHEKAKYYDAYQRIAELLNLPKDKCVATIHAQRFYDYAGKLEAVWMYVDVWKLNAKKPDTVWITPKDRLADKAAFERGQKKAQSVYDAIFMFGVKQDKESLIRQLQRGEADWNDLL